MIIGSIIAIIGIVLLVWMFCSTTSRFEEEIEELNDEIEKLKEDVEELQHDKAGKM